METQFQKTVCAYLENAVYQLQDQEQTQELRLPDGMPDIGRVLGVWGQPLVRSKEWQSDSVRVNCGVMTWILYAPEDGSAPRCLQAWIPFQQSFAHTCGNREGVMQVQCSLRSVDARIISNRKLMLRSVINVLAQAWVDAKTEIYKACDLPADVCMLTNTYLPRLLKEAGEKPFVIDEELTLPPSAVEPESIVRYDLRWELIDRKVLTDKLVFRGAGVIHILYLDADASLHSCDLEVPVSQYCNLTGEYPDDASVDVSVAITGLELDKDPEGHLRLKAGLTGQYTIYACEQVALVQDAYSPRREVSVKLEQLQLPAVLDRDNVRISVQQRVAPELGKIADVAFYPDQPRCTREQDRLCADLGGVFHILSEDQEGQLNPVQLRWQEKHTLEAAPESWVQMWAVPSGTIQSGDMSQEGSIACDVILSQQTVATQGLAMVSGIELGQEETPDFGKPNLILRRADGKTLWELAKQTGSTVEAICQANGIADDSDVQQQMLLIPVC